MLRASAYPCIALQVGDNLAEWMIDIIIKAERSGTAQDICDAYETSPLAKSNYLQLSRFVTDAMGTPASEDLPGTAKVVITNDTAAGGLIADEAALSWGAKLFGVGTYVTSPLWSLRVLLQYR